MTGTFARFMEDESGATAIEYGLIGALISVAIITGATLLGNQLNILFDKLGNKMTNVASPPTPPATPPNAPWGPDRPAR